MLDVCWGSCGGDLTYKESSPMHCSRKPKIYNYGIVDRWYLCNCGTVDILYLYNIMQLWIVLVVE